MKPPADSGTPLRVEGRAGCPQPATHGAVGTPRPTEPREHVRAVLFDIYATLLEVGPPPPDADARWQRLFRESLGTEPPLGRVEFFAACSQVIGRHHAAARRQGVPWPEIQWPSIVLEVLPGLARLLGEPAEGRTGEPANGREGEKASAAHMAGSA